jgi:2-dehydro-3-deoxygluconokinase
MADAVSYARLRSAGSCRWDAVALGEVMLRLDPRDVPVARMRDAVLTALVADDIGANIRNQLREAGVDTSRILWWSTKALRAASGGGVKASR